ncbi:uncharacterized protein (TIGR02284 family) [Palleronia aestuarii]|uniref:Uncharacterized protein (TIGR02284 family) n=1 Tax=Palleronia aestuarii TaxID=568105 RepID=A0A2W7NFY5_9RHOB|nr:PA2169 family four-helix-bundle protein [Palleronia aestuarii]PZX17087.1 uncharacterized protein (TIGR02284 family) [Palleronia aestuarii]
MSDKDKALQTLHTRLIDSRDGYRQAREQLGDDDLGHFVDRCIAEREGFHQTLHEALSAEGVTVDEDGSTAAALHRGVFKLRDAISSGPGGTYAECARGDGYLKSAYDDAIEATDGAPRWQFLVEQRAKVDATIKEAEALA